MNRSTRVALLLVFLVQVLLLAALGWRQRYSINFDGANYIRVAQYYARGQSGLMISGYWGPMLSWLMAPLLHVVPTALDAVRVVMALSAAYFLGGSMVLFRRLDLPPWGIVAGSCVVALASAAWSVAFIAPDLLLGGSLFLGMAGLLSPSWPASRRTQLGTGLAFGLAYLTKAVALPVFFLLLALVFVVRVMHARGALRPTVVALAATVVSFAVLAAPWIGVLSWKYHRPIFSTAGRVNHALVAPGHAYGDHPQVFMAPARGGSSWTRPTSILTRTFTGRRSTVSATSRTS